MTMGRTEYLFFFSLEIILLMTYFYRRGFKFCRKRSIQDQDSMVVSSPNKNNKLQVGFTNSAVSMEIEEESGHTSLKGVTDRYKGLQKESKVYEEIRDDVLEKQDESGYIDPQRPSGAYEEVPDDLIEEDQAEYALPQDQPHQNNAPNDSNRDLYLDMY